MINIGQPLRDFSFHWSTIERFSHSFGQPLRDLVIPLVNHWEILSFLWSTIERFCHFFLWSVCLFVLRLALMDRNVEMAQQRMDDIIVLGLTCLMALIYLPVHLNGVSSITKSKSRLALVFGAILCDPAHVRMTSDYLRLIEQPPTCLVVLKVCCNWFAHVQQYIALCHDSFITCLSYYCCWICNRSGCNTAHHLTFEKSL